MPADCYQRLKPNFKYWEKIKDIIDQYIDIMLNYRQSGHPGGSRSKAHALGLAPPGKAVH